MEYVRTDDQINKILEVCKQANWTGSSNWTGNLMEPDSEPFTSEFCSYVNKVHQNLNKSFQPFPIADEAFQFGLTTDKQIYIELQLEGLNRLYIFVHNGSSNGSDKENSCMFELPSDKYKYACVLCNLFVSADLSYEMILHKLKSSSACEYRKNSTDKYTRISKTEYYLEIAKTVAKRSTCIRRQYGAVLVKNDEIISTGYNGSPRGKDNCCDLKECWRESNNIPHGEQYEKCVSVHAEQNAIISASRNEMIGSTLYLAGFENGKLITATPCTICERMIINAGIRKIIKTCAEGSYYEQNLSD